MDQLILWGWPPPPKSLGILSLSHSRGSSIAHRFTLVPDLSLNPSSSSLLSFARVSYFRGQELPLPRACHSELPHRGEHLRRCLPTGPEYPPRSLWVRLGRPTYLLSLSLSLSLSQIHGFSPLHLLESHQLPNSLNGCSLTSEPILNNFFCSSEVISGFFLHSPSIKS